MAWPLLNFAGVVNDLPAFVVALTGRRGPIGKPITPFPHAFAVPEAAFRHFLPVVPPAAPDPFPQTVAEISLDPHFPGWIPTGPCTVLVAVIKLHFLPRSSVWVPQLPRTVHIAIGITTASIFPPSGYWALNKPWRSVRCWYVLPKILICFINRSRPFNIKSALSLPRLIRWLLRARNNTYAATCRGPVKHHPSLGQVRYLWTTIQHTIPHLAPMSPGYSHPPARSVFSIKDS